MGIIQARLASSRLPRKIFEAITPVGEHLLEVVVARTLLAKKLTDIIVATSDNSLDDEVSQWCNQNSIKCFRGSESDVLKRYVDAASINCADLIVRITADDPFKDPIEIDELVEFAEETRVPYASNNLSHEIPEGMDLEAFTFENLQNCDREANRPYEREHVTPWMRQRAAEYPEKFSAERYKKWPEVRLTVDVVEDLQFTRSVYQDLRGGSHHSTADLISHLNSHPELISLNSGAVEQYAGLKKSMKEDGYET